MFKKIFFALIFLLQSQTLFADISNKIVLTVGSLPITLYDLKQEVKLLSILNPGKLENESIEDLQSLGIESLTIKKIKEQEIKKNKLDDTEDEEFIEYEIQNLKYFSPSKDSLFFWQTSNGPLPCVNKDMIEYFSTYYNHIPQMRTKNIKDGFLSSKPEHK